MVFILCDMIVSKNLESFTDWSSNRLLHMQKIEEYAALKDEISLLHITVPLSFFCLDCIQVNEELAGRAQKLKDRLIQYEVNENRELNRR